MGTRNSLQLARRMAALEPSATLAMAARAQALAASGVDVIDLSVGEPDFPTPPHICAAAEAAIGLAILVVLFRNRSTINVDELDALKG